MVSLHPRTHRGHRLALVFSAALSMTAWAFPAVASALPEGGTYLASFCTLAPNQPVQCEPASAQVAAEAMRVRVPKGKYEFTFGPRQVEVEAHVSGRPQAHFLADYDWHDGKTLRFSETQPTRWEVRLGERKTP